MQWSARSKGINDENGREIWVKKEMLWVIEAWRRRRFRGSGMMCTEEVGEGCP